MGYRYDVGLAVTKRLLAELKANTESYKLLKVADQEISVLEGNLFIWTTVKWDDTYADIAALEKIIFSMEEDYWFVIVGEEEYVETLGEWHDNPFQLGYSTTLCYDGCNNQSKSEISDVELKEVNSRSTSNYCARCGEKLKVPQPSIKFCPICEG
jgi:hypothetical protein